MNKMRFDVKCVKECLVENKIVYTVRSWEGYKELTFVSSKGEPSPPPKGGGYGEPSAIIVSPRLGQVDTAS